MDLFNVDRLCSWSGRDGFDGREGGVESVLDRGSLTLTVGAPGARTGANIFRVIAPMEAVWTSSTCRNRVQRGKWKQQDLPRLHKTQESAVVIEEEAGEELTAKLFSGRAKISR
jgi:hypothetical protein